MFSFSCITSKTIKKINTRHAMHQQDAVTQCINRMLSHRRKEFSVERFVQTELLFTAIQQL